MAFSMQDEVASPILSELTQGLAPVGAVVERRTLADVTADDVLLIIDMQHDFLPGGNFGVAEGDQCIKPVVRLIDAFACAGASVVATRDYHPIDHCSFEAQGGPFPQHCVQGTKGAFLHDDVAAALQPLVASGQALIAFKAFARDLDSFGAFEYTPSAAPGRLCRRNACALSWSGSFLLFASNAVHDCNAPPDVMAVMSRQPLANVIRPKAGRKLYVCGLAFDFCVADTALNARAAGFDHVSIILGATRAAHLNGTFVNPPATVGGRLVEGGVSLVDFE